MNRLLDWLGAPEERADPYFWVHLAVMGLGFALLVWVLNPWGPIW